MVVAAVGKLGGAARDWHRNTGGGLGEWAAWRDGLCRAFGRTMTNSRWIQLVSARVQKPGETNTEYSHAKQRLCLRAPHGIQEEEIIRKLILGLDNPSYRAALSASRPQTLAEYFVRIRDLDKLDQEMAQKGRALGAATGGAGGHSVPAMPRPGSFSNPHTVSFSTPTVHPRFPALCPVPPRPVGEVVDGRYTVRGERTPEVVRSGGPEDWLRARECYNCHLKGHLARDCPERRSASSTSGDLEIGGRKGVQTMIDSGADFSM